MKKLAMLLLVGFAWVTLQGASCRGLVQPTPTEAEIQRVHRDAKRIGDAVTMVSSILNQAGVFVDALPIPAAAKNDLDCGIVKAVGTSQPRPQLLTICGPSTPQGPGPVVIALEKIKSLTTEVGLQTTVREITSVVQPLLAQMQTSTNSTVKALGVGLGAALAILTAFLNGAF